MVNRKSRKQSKSKKKRNISAHVCCKYSNFFPFDCIVMSDFKNHHLCCPRLRITIDPKLKRCIFECKKPDVAMHGLKKVYRELTD